MNIDKPRCNFKNCRYCFDGNCINEVRREDCEYHQDKNHESVSIMHLVYE